MQQSRMFQYFYTYVLFCCISQPTQRNVTPQKDYDWLYTITELGRKPGEYPGDHPNESYTHRGKTQGKYLSGALSYIGGKTSFIENQDFECVVPFFCNSMSEKKAEVSKSAHYNHK